LKFTGSVPDKLFTYYIENLFMIISINSGSWGEIMVIMLNTETWVIGKGGTERDRGKEGG
jgi:hypothetical protein